MHIIHVITSSLEKKPTIDHDIGGNYCLNGLRYKLSLWKGNRPEINESEKKCT